MAVGQIIVFEDRQAGDLYPATLTRPSFAITCGGYRLWELLVNWDLPMTAWVRPHLEVIVREDFLVPLAKQRGQTPPDNGHGSGSLASSADAPVLLVNASLVPGVSIVRRLRQWAQEGQPAVVRSGDRVAAAVVPGPAALQGLTLAQLSRGFLNPMPGDVEEPAELSGELSAELLHRSAERALPEPLGRLAEAPLELPLLHYPHEIIRYHLEIFQESLQDRLAKGTYEQPRPGVFVAPGVKLPDPLVTETSEGPIVIESGTKIGSYAYLSGPVLIGANSKVLEHAALKDHVVLAHTTKVGGEVEASIIEPYSNKQHHGFLGHSHLGSWINLGAGTSNSDLKNTYGEVNLNFNGRKLPTKMQFMGCVIGDYAKTAINTSIFTGKLIGPGSLIYGFVTTNVPSFVNYARSFGQQTEIPLEVVLATQGRMFARRQRIQRGCDMQLLRDVFQMTANERLQLAEEPLSL